MRDIQDAVEHGPVPVYPGPPAFPYLYQPALAMLDIVLGGHPQWNSVPEALVDGVVVARGRGTWHVPAAPGPHTVVLRCQGFGIKRKVHLLRCVVGAGCAAQVNYRLEHDGHSRAWVGGRTPGVPQAPAALVVVPIMLMVVTGMLVLLMMLVVAAA